MIISFSDHAILQLRTRKLKKALVISAVKMPNRIIIQSNGRLQAIKLFLKSKKKYLIVVIYENLKDDKKIITAFITSKVKKYII
ncbi:MAG: DUF4258 domain-containing protein [Patescibacteria group bacterium]